VSDRRPALLSSRHESSGMGGVTSQAQGQARSRYEGETVRGLKHGRGKLWYPSGSVYVGSWARDKKHGEGRFESRDGSVYEGEWVDDCKQGRGRLLSKRGAQLVYEGEWLADKMHGEWSRVESSRVESS
jgi:hypothetical protein